MGARFEYFKCAALFLSIMLAIPALPQEVNCSSDKAQFQKLNAPLFYHGGADRDEQARYQKEKKAGTQQLHDFITAVVLRDLAHGNDSASTRRHLECMMGTGDVFSNSPAVFAGKVSNVPITVTAVLIPRGGQVILDSRPLVQCFAKHGSTWDLVGEVGEELERSTLDIHQLKSPVKTEAWYLVSGSRIGDSGGRLLMEVVACDGKKVDVKWRRGDLRYGTVEVDPNATTVRLSYEKLTPDGRVQFPSSPTTEVLKVTPKGME